MKLSECRMGTIVVKEEPGNKSSIGYIVGLAFNRDKETIPVVKFPLESPVKIHHKYLELYEE